MKLATWAAIAAGSAVIVGFGAGALVRRRRHVLLGTISYDPRVQLGKGPRSLTDAQRLSSVLSSWMVLTDLSHAQWGEPSGSSLQQFVMGPGDLLSNVRDLIGAETPKETADDAIAMWDRDPRAVLAAADALLRERVKQIAAREQQSGEPLDIGGGKSASLIDVAEQYASDAAISYLASTIPGAGLLTAAAAEAGVTWSFSSGRQDVGAGVQRLEWLRYRQIAFRRALDLIEHATGA